MYGRDWSLQLDPAKLIPTVGATGGINLACSVFERAGVALAYITDAPTYAGFIARAGLNANAEIFSVEMGADGPIVVRFRDQVRAARAAGRFVPFRRWQRPGRRCFERVLADPRAIPAWPKPVDGANVAHAPPMVDSSH